MTDQRQQIDLNVVRDETAFRSTVLTELRYISKDMEELKEGLKDHIEKDEQRFGAVTNEINVNKNGISRGTGILIGVVALLGFVMWLIDRLQP